MTNTLRDHTFETFATAVARFGDAVIESPTLWYVMVGDVKCEIKRNTMTFGFGLGAEAQTALRDILTEYGYTLPDRQPQNYTNVLYSDDVDDLEYFTAIADIMVDSGLIKPSKRRDYTGINREGLFANIATVIKSASDTGMYSMINRRVFDEVDDIISLNEKTKTNDYREHIVPCVMIIDEAFRMFDNGASIAEVAVMIQSNLFIVHIPTETAKYIDFTLGLKTTMPDDWKFGDDPLARLNVANIII